MFEESNAQELQEQNERLNAKFQNKCEGIRSAVINRSIVGNCSSTQLHYAQSMKYVSHFCNIE